MAREEDEGGEAEDVTAAHEGAEASMNPRFDKEEVRRASPIERVIPELISEHPIEAGGELKVRCPWHDDKRPSLRIRPGKGVWHCDPCGLGGDVFAFVEKFWHCDFSEGLTRLAERAGLASESQRSGREIAAYDYRDEDGHLQYQKVRLEPKDFRLRRPDGAGGWLWNLNGTRRIIYRLPELKGKSGVLVVEGEKDVDRAWAIGVPATCNPDGASEASKQPKWTGDYTRQLVAAGVQRVRIIPDNDRAGRAHAEAIAQSCHAAGLDVRIVPLPDVPEKGDLSDYLVRHTKDDLVAVLKAAQPYSPATVAVGVTVEEPSDEQPHKDPWPQALSRAAYVGIVGDIVDVLAPHTEADPVALLVQLLAMFGSVIGRTAHFRVGADIHHLNLFLALVGASAKGRKGVSAGQAARLFRPIDEHWTADCQVTGLSSGEGLIYAVRDAVEKQQPIKERGRIIGYEPVIEDHGVSDKRLYVEESEFASTLKVMMREGNTLSPVVRNAWDGKTLRTLTRNSPLKATGPHISIAASITQHEVRRYLEVTESANGFGNRFLWVCVRRSQFLPDGGAYVDVDPLVERLRQLVIAAKDVSEMTRDRKAGHLWHAEYRALSAGRPGLLGSITGRAEAQVMRLACLYALGDGARVVQEKHLEAALELWRYCFDSAAYIFGESLGDSKADALLAALKAVGTAGLSRSEMIREVFQGHITTRELSRLLSLLQHGQLASCRQKPTDGPGRPAECWFATLRTCERSELIPRTDNSFASFAYSQPSATTGLASADVFEVI
jgi:hypothetical protein